MSLRTIDLGDIDLVFGFKVKGTEDIYLRWRWGVPRKVTPEDRIKSVSPFRNVKYGRATHKMDLKADNKVTATPEFTDEEENVVPTPADFSATYAVDRTDLVTVTDNGDGSVTFAAAGGAGNLGEARVHGEATYNGRTATMDDIINVVAGDAERFALKFGTPEEITPDV